MGRVRGVLLKGFLRSILVLVLATFMILASSSQKEPIVHMSSTIVRYILGIFLGILVNACMTLVEQSGELTDPDPV